MAETKPPEAADPGQSYSWLCLMALGVIAVALTEFGLGAIAFVPLGLGAVGLWMRWASGPPLLLLTLGCVIAYVSGLARAGMSPGGRGGFGVVGFSHDPVSPVNLAVCAASVAFVIGYYRYLAFADRVFPADPSRPPADELEARLIVRRGPASTSPGELTNLLFTIPLWCGLGFFLWSLLSRVRPPFGMGFSQARGEWGLFVLCWVVAVTGLVVAAVVRLLGQTQATPTQHLIYLQDQVWRETRREQSRLNRWLVWSRLRGQRRKEGR